MKNTIGLAVLAVVAIGLAITLYVINNNASEERRSAKDRELGFSNDLATASAKLEEQLKVNTALEGDKKSLTDDKSKLSVQLASTQTTLADTEKSLKASKDEVTDRDKRITELQAANAQLDRDADALSLSISNLTDTIHATRQKLATTEGDKAFLQKELDRLMAEKAELERQFNDIVIVRAQVAKLREEMNVNRRLDWIRKGILGTADKKGSQRLMQSGPSSTPPPASQPSTPRYDLNVEVQSDGSVRVIPPTTNAPAAAPK